MKFGLENWRRLSPAAQLGRLLVGASSPTASLYFENACQDWLCDGRVQKICGTVFASDMTQVIFRHDLGAPLGFTRPNMVYFMDDYWQFDKDLPWQYRQKSKIVEQRAARFFQPRATWLGVSSKPLEKLARRQYPKANIKIVSPYWSEKFADFDHFSTQTLEICYLGARTHAHDLELVIPAIREVLRVFPNARFTLSNTHVLPNDLARHPQVKWIEQMDWPNYRQKIVDMRFHIALYPLTKSKFNEARSGNKLIEHAVVGAATLCSDHWLKNSTRAISVGESAENWVQKLCEMAGKKDILKKIAQANKAAVLLANQAKFQKAIWEQMLFPK